MDKRWATWYRGAAKDAMRRLGDEGLIRVEKHVSGQTDGDKTHFHVDVHSSFGR